jgi:hypothetical protein
VNNFQEIQHMKKSISRFALMAILGSILSSAFMVGCGGGGDDESAPANTAKKTDADGSKDAAKDTP